MKNALIDETKKILEIFYKIPFIIQKMNIFEYLNKIYDKYKRRGQDILHLFLPYKKLLSFCFILLL